MYGMMPSAKIEIRRRLPPENKSRTPKREPAASPQIVLSVSWSIPGTGICIPAR